MCGHVHAGQPRVEKPSGRRSPRGSQRVYRVAKAAAAVATNARRVVIGQLLVSATTAVDGSENCGRPRPQSDRRGEAFPRTPKPGRAKPRPPQSKTGGGTGPRPG